MCNTFYTMSLIVYAIIGQAACALEVCPWRKSCSSRNEYGPLIPPYELGRFICPAKGRCELMDIDDYCKFWCGLTDSFPKITNKPGVTHYDSNTTYPDESDNLPKMLYLAIANHNTSTDYSKLRHSTLTLGPGGDTRQTINI